MGNAVSHVRTEIRNAVDVGHEERVKQEERLNLLEAMVTARIENAKQNILNGERNDQQIHTGTVVEYTHQVSISLSKKTNPDLEEAISDFLSGSLRGAANGFAKIAKVGVGAVLGNHSMGQHEGTSMFVMWTENSLVRLDAYFYRWNFTSNEVIAEVEGASGVIMMKRIIDLTKTDPQVLTWAISRQAELLDRPDDASQMIDEAIAIIKKVHALQDSLRAIQSSED